MYDEIAFYRSESCSISEQPHDPLDALAAALETLESAADEAQLAQGETLVAIFIRKRMGRLRTLLTPVETPDFGLTPMTLRRAKIDVPNLVPCPVCLHQG